MRGFGKKKKNEKMMMKKKKRKIMHNYSDKELVEDD